MDFDKSWDGRRAGFVHYLFVGRHGRELALSYGQVMLRYMLERRLKISDNWDAGTELTLGTTTVTCERSDLGMY
jgi:hypothetical protein